MRRTLYEVFSVFIYSEHSRTEIKKLRFLVLRRLKAELLSFLTMVDEN